DDAAGIDRDLAAVGDEDVVLVAALEGVVAAGAEEEVFAVVSVHCVDAVAGLGLDGDDVVLDGILDAAVAEEPVLAAAAVDFVVSGHAGDGFTAAAAEEVIVARAAEDLGRAGAARARLDGVVAGVALEVILDGTGHERGVDRVVALAAQADDRARAL